MKLLLDQNLSPRLVPRLRDAFPECAHVRDFGLASATDRGIWEFAIDHRYAIVSKDSDFHQLAFTEGPPPKVIWIQRGNCSTSAINELLLQAEPSIRKFLADGTSSFLVLS